MLRQASELADRHPSGDHEFRVLADRASLELYANEGATVASTYEFGTPENLKLKIESQGDVKIHSLVVNELKSIWQKTQIN